MGELGNELKETTKEIGSMTNLLPRFCDALESIGTFDDADKPLNNSEDDETFVTPHWVDGYTKADGTNVDGYWRDGDGDTSVNLNEDEGGGYLRSL